MEIKARKLAKKMAKKEKKSKDRDERRKRDYLKSKKKKRESKKGNTTPLVNIEELDKLVDLPPGEELVTPKNTKGAKDAVSKSKLGYYNVCPGAK